MSLLHTAQFLDTVVRLEHLPKDDLPEIAFVGRSNAGKSSAINTLCERKRLAYASKTPGRTQALNLFNLRLPASANPESGTSANGQTKPRADRLPQNLPVLIGRLVDTPGYGYAEAPIHTKAQWDRLAGQYLQARKNLRAVVLISDARRGLTALDEDLLGWIAPHIPVLMLLTKADKLTHQARLLALKAMRQTLESPDVPGEQNRVHCLLFSATHRIGLDETRQRISAWLESSLPVA
ncbi:MAG: GTP-binding protein [Betaproteobacteria bacterium]|nr:GTP-binding protein [Betaproteobacteria bacterium]